MNAFFIIKINMNMKYQDKVLEKVQEGRGFLNEFKKFAMRGNLVDLAIGVILGAAFGKIVTSFVSDVLMPPLSLLTGQKDFTQMFLPLRRDFVGTLAEAKAKGIPVLAYGTFLQSVIDFLVVAFVIFLFIRQMNKFIHKEAAAAPATKECQFCKMPIPISAMRCPHCTSAIN